MKSIILKFCKCLDIQMGSKIDQYFGLKFCSRVKFLIFTQAIVFILGFGFLLHCREIPLAGVTHNQMAIKPSYNLEDLHAECNKECNCGSKFEPVCGYDNVLVISLSKLNTNKYKCWKSYFYVKWLCGRNF